MAHSSGEVEKEFIFNQKNHEVTKDLILCMIYEMIEEYKLDHRFICSPTYTAKVPALAECLLLYNMYTLCKQDQASCLIETVKTMTKNFIINQLWMDLESGKHDYIITAREMRVLKQMLRQMRKIYDIASSVMLFEEPHLNFMELCAARELLSMRQWLEKKDTYDLALLYCQNQLNITQSSESAETKQKNIEFMALRESFLLKLPPVSLRDMNTITLGLKNGRFTALMDALEPVFPESEEELSVSEQRRSTCNSHDELIEQLKGDFKAILSELHVTLHILQASSSQSAGQPQAAEQSQSTSNAEVDNMTERNRPTSDPDNIDGNHSRSVNNTECSRRT